MPRMDPRHFAKRQFRQLSVRVSLPPDFRPAREIVRHDHVQALPRRVTLVAAPGDDPGAAAFPPPPNLLPDSRSYSDGIDGTPQRPFTFRTHRVFCNQRKSGRLRVLYLKGRVTSIFRRVLLFMRELGYCAELRPSITHLPRQCELRIQRFCGSPGAHDQPALDTGIVGGITPA